MGLSAYPGALGHSQQAIDMEPEVCGELTGKKARRAFDTERLARCSMWLRRMKAER